MSSDFNSSFKNLPPNIRNTLSTYLEIKAKIKLEQESLAKLNAASISLIESLIEEITSSELPESEKHEILKQLYCLLPPDQRAV